MTMSWSHTIEGSYNARENLITWAQRESSRKEMAIILAEWGAHDRCNDDTEDSEFGPKYLADIDRYQKLPGDILADEIWSRAETLRLCDNDFARLHLCPYGCEEHKVGVDLTLATRHRLADEA